MWETTRFWEVDMSLITLTLMVVYSYRRSCVCQTATLDANNTTTWKWTVALLLCSK